MTLLNKPSSRWPKISLLIVTFGLEISGLHAAGLVDFVTPTGSGAPERNLAAAPFQTVAAAVQALPPAGGTVSVAPGIYREDVIGENPFQYLFLRDKLGAIGGHDAARNAPNVSVFNSPAALDTYKLSNELAVYWGGQGPFDQRLDYVWYLPSLNGNVTIQPEHVERILQHAGAAHPLESEDCDELSDHYPIRANFRLFRTP